MSSSRAWVAISIMSYFVIDFSIDIILEMPRWVNSVLALTTSLVVAVASGVVDRKSAAVVALLWCCGAGGSVALYYWFGPRSYPICEGVLIAAVILVISVIARRACWRSGEDDTGH